MNDMDLVVWLETFGQPGVPTGRIRRQMLALRTQYRSIYRKKVREARRLKEAYEQAA